MNLCYTCGCERHFAAKPGNCQNCHTKQKRESQEADYLLRLDNLGYDVNHYDQAKGIHGKVNITNRNCKHSFSAKLNNVLNQKTVCGVCGPTKRAANALKHYIDKHGRTYDITVWNDYKREVWQLTNNYYKANKHKLNPMGFPRKKAGTHPDAVNLDHIIPMIYCFKNSFPVELAADPMNIQIIPAVDNLSKKQKLTEESNNLLKLLKIKHSVI